MKLTAILLSLFVCFHGAYAQDNFMFPPMPAEPGGVFFTGPMVCEEIFLSEEMMNDTLRVKDWANANIPHPFPSVCAIYNSSGQTRGYLGGYGKWCVTITEATTQQSKAAMFAACGFTCDNMNLNNTIAALPMSLEQRLPEETDIGAGATLDIIDEWMVELLETGEDGPALEQAMQLSSSFMLSVHACRLHECEDVAQCQRVADTAFEEMLESGIELDIDMDVFDSLEDARELALLLGSRP